jgi:hypothetical protein
MIAAILPRVGVGNKIPIILPKPDDAKLASCLLANLNSLPLDYTIRQKVGGSTINHFIVKQLPVLCPSMYTARDVEYVMIRVLELTYTAYNMQPFAKDLGYGGPPFIWDENRRALLCAELDAYYARLYGLTRKQLRYILDPHDLTDHELADIHDPCEDPPDAPRTKEFPGETFRALKDREMRQYGEYRTRRLVLAAWDHLKEHSAY